MNTFNHVSRTTAALILILDPALRSRATHSDLYNLYHLTATETALANRLMDGRSVVNCSRELGISRFTAKSHLDSIFKKTGVSRQRQLVRLLLRSIGVIRLAQPGRPASGD
jgi:DNA-binding CsgD family transcriptional regulator